MFNCPIYQSNSTKKLQRSTKIISRRPNTSCAYGPTQPDCSHLSFLISYFIICSVVLRMYTRPPTLTQRAPDGKRLHLYASARTGIFSLFSKQRFLNVSRLGGSSRCQDLDHILVCWFSLWNINKAVSRAAWQAGAPGLLHHCLRCPLSLTEQGLLDVCWKSKKLLKLSSLIIAL